MVYEIVRSIGIHVQLVRRADIPPWHRAAAGRKGATVKGKALVVKAREERGG